MITVSINIPCYNRKEMLRECIESFIAQSFKDWELILIDDGSEEDLTFVSGMDERVRYIRQPHDGIAKAFNRALDNSSGKYIVPFGSDDLASPNLLEEMVGELEANPEIDVIYPNYWVLNSSGKKHRRIMRVMPPLKEAYNLMLNRQFIPHPATLWRKESMPRYDESLESAVDWELFLTALERGVRFKHHKKKLWTYRVGHEREGTSERQVECCDRLLRKRGYYFDRKLRRGFPCS